MKKIIVIAIAVFCIKSGFSQDVIITKAGESIRAKILEVTDETVSYKKYNDQEGATFVLKIGKIKIISWENGDVDDYEKVSKVLPQQQENPSLGQVEDNLPYITNRKGKTFYLDNGQVYNEVQFKQFLLERNLGSVWLQYSNNKNLMHAGVIMICGGVFFEIIGLVIGVNSLYYGTWNQYITGMTFFYLGGAATIAGIPIAIIGGIRRNRSIQDYNALYGGKPRSQYSQNITLKAGHTGKGLGFTLNF
jgi:hypothetical protein